MKYLLLLMMLSPYAVAEIAGVRFLRVACDGGTIVKTYIQPKPSDLEAADAYADSLVCPRGGRAWVEKNYWYKPRLSAASSSSSSSSQAASSSSSSAQMVTVTFIRPMARENGQVLAASEIGGYELRRCTAESIPVGGDLIKHSTKAPLPTESFYLLAYDKAGTFSKWLSVTY